MEKEKFIKLRRLVLILSLYENGWEEASREMEEQTYQKDVEDLKKLKLIKKFPRKPTLTKKGEQLAQRFDFRFKTTLKHLFFLNINNQKTP